jgi:serine/threonine-protein kinase
MEILSEATVDPIEALRIVVRGEADGHFEEASIPSTLYPLSSDDLSGEVPKLPQPPSIPQFGGVAATPRIAAPVTTAELALRKSTLVGLGTDFSSSAPPPPRPAGDSVQMSPIIELAGEAAPSVGTREATGVEQLQKVEPVPAQRRVLGSSSSPPRDSESGPVSEPADSLIGSDVPMREPETVDAKSRVRYVGRYEVIHRIGRGGMGSVYLSRLTTEGGFRRLFALKLLRSYLSRDSDAAEAFLAEARLAGQLHHTNVVGVVDAGVHRGQPFLVMDYVEGCSLKQLLMAAAEDRPSRLIVPIILDALAGLHALHCLPGDDGAPLEVVHCDVSPENLLVGTDGVCRLTDFGVARRSKVDGGHSTHGKPGYLAPEQVTGAPIDRRVDIFAMGVVLWSALTGERLFHGATVEETLQRVCSQPIPPPSTVGLKPPKVFDGVVLKALERDPELRFESAEAMQVALRDAAHQEGFVALPSETAAWVRKVVGRELSHRRLLILEATRPAGSTIPPGQLDSTQLPQADDEMAPFSRSASSRSYKPYREDGDSRTIPLSEVQDGGSRVALLVVGLLATAAVLVAILWPAALSKLFRINVSAGQMSSQPIEAKLLPADNESATVAPSTSSSVEAIVSPVPSAAEPQTVPGSQLRVNVLPVAPGSSVPSSLPLER